MASNSNSNSNSNSLFQNDKNNNSNTDIAVPTPNNSSSFRNTTITNPTPSIRSPSPSINSYNNSAIPTTITNRSIPGMSNSSINDSADSNPQSYDEQISQLNNLQNKKSLDFKTISKHLINQEDSLKTQGGDITRRLYHQMENISGSNNNNNANNNTNSNDLDDNVSIGGHSTFRDGPPPRLRTRSASFSSYLEETRRGSMASDINIPGGFRREFLINKAIQRNQQPPNFLTQNFMEFLSIYGHFAGEDFSDEDEDDDDEEEEEEEEERRDGEEEYNADEVFDEESSLLGNERRGGGLPFRQLPKKPHSHLPKKPPKGTASVFKTFLLLFKALVGSGVLFLPRAFYNGGMLFSMITLSLFGLLTFLCYIGLIQSKTILNLSSFGELGYKTYGKPLKYCILVSILLSQIGFVTTYILFTAENMIAFLSQYVSTKGNSLLLLLLGLDSSSEVLPNWLNRGNLILIQCILLIPLVLIRNLAKLSMVSLISSIFIIIGLLIIFWYSSINLINNGVGPNITNFNSNSWTMLIGVAVTSFEGIGLILPIQSSMTQPEKFPLVLSISMLIITSIFVAIGTIGYFSFGDKIKSIIILNLPQNQFAVQSILVLYSIAVFLSGPLQLFPAIKIGESLIFRHSKKNTRRHHHHHQHHHHRHHGSTEEGNNTGDDNGKLYHQSGKYNPQVKWLKNGFRAISVMFICSLAYLNADNIDKFVSFNGCFACIPLVYIYPPLIHLKSIQSKQQNKGKSKSDQIFIWLDYLLIVVGIATVIYSSYQILFLN
ncbi:vacuolar amino acid transporter, putative [Candida dubliniensis CD36]|uniref:Vacuolar amino acid transporter, putative n=1 Tax=Candida dubliniensis (strain CD36 / ATCC MYA-646 / CBS 7987 / NCPF 3949 / NRRL Y-17841) TaxID=573826 RepID=B9WED3_CANDC|nr:vacuolar amino acid transporter, putative [Candida dubliniensis CD36]CAX43044.1 vacuolar amino acid transporter, putative [Candida dubliniensis CD36]